jgi:carbon storage regulator
MVILTRRPGDTIRINDRVRVTVLRVQANQVRIGIEAPASVSVDREEVWQRKQCEAERAHAVAPPRLTLTLNRPMRRIDEPAG